MLASFNGWGVTVFDSLDTMILMGLHDEFARGLRIVEKARFPLPSVSIIYADLDSRTYYPPVLGKRRIQGTFRTFL